MSEFSLASLASLYVLLGIIGLYSLFLCWWQIQVLKGKVMLNVDGSCDSWQQQKTHYGIAVADILLACPLNLIAILTVFIVPKWAFFMLTMSSFWWLWSNTMTTATSLRFEKPRFTLQWFLVYPFGILIGLLLLIWILIHFDSIF